jgi:arginine deiminase
MVDPEAIFMDMVEVLRKMEEDKTRCGLHEHYLLEGGNIIILDEHTLAIGVGRHEYLYSNRTTRAAFELLVQHIMDRDTAGTIQRIYLVNVPDLRGFIHLDTVFNMVGPKSAIVMPYIFGHPEPESGETPRQVLENFVAWVRGHMEATQTDLSRIPSVQHFAHAGKVEIYDRDYMRQKGRIERLPVTSKYFLDQLIEDNLLDPAKIAWIGGSPDEYVSAYEHLMVALFEQHNMAGNVFTAAPYQAIAYHRNPLTADHLLDTMRRSAPDAHLERMSSNEIRTDNGGPHCLTMPLLRED